VLLAPTGDEVEAGDPVEHAGSATGFVEHWIQRGSGRPHESVPAELIRCTFGTTDAASPEPTTDPAWWQDLFEERAANREFDAGYPRREAERLAWEECLSEWHRQHGGQGRPICASLF
jgi:hypothetical protein